MRFRLLPVFILLAALGTGVKLAGLWQAIGAATPAFAAGQPPAQGNGGQGNGGQGSGQPPAPGGAQSTAQANGQPAAAQSGTAQAGKTTESAVPPSQITDLSSNVFKMTDEEVVLLQSLAKRREELDQRAREIDQREVLLKAAEKRIDQKIADLKQLQKSIEGLLAKHDQQTDQQMKSLVKIYSNMKPKDAARIFERLDMQVLLDVIERMKERKSAPILAQMSPKRAEEVTLELAQRRELPMPRK